MKKARSYPTIAITTTTQQGEQVSPLEIFKEGQYYPTESGCSFALFKKGSLFPKKYFVMYNTTKDVVIITVVGVTISGDCIDQCTRQSLKDAILTARLLSNKYNGCEIVHKLNKVATGNGMSEIN